MRQFYFSNHCGLNLSARCEYSKRLYLCETDKFIRFFLFMMSKGNHYFAPGHAADGWRLWRNRDKRPCWRVILRLSFFFRNFDSSIPRFLTYFNELFNSRIFFLFYRFYKSNLIMQNTLPISVDFRQFPPTFTVRKHSSTP